ncbi:MAG: InlB B-repeat-containing protein [Candidatus Methanomethylophilaceae archaeon]|nr:InlB B-repeat-containing protein [Candidatus Methanomethylophilaceae archaeon]
MNRNAIVLTAFLAIAALLVPTQIASFDSDADEEPIDSNIWICYGRNISIRDHNYDDKTYSSIEWRYSTVKANLDIVDPVKNVALEFNVPFEICADDTYITYYVRENAVVSGTPLSEDLTVLVNPSSYVRYVKFMYNDGTDTTYYNAPVTSEKGYKYGTQLLVDPPAKDPVRPGYKFTGWFVDTACETPYDRSYYHLFDASRITHIYAKWDYDPSQPVYDMVKIDLQPVDGLKFTYDGLVIPKGTNFTYTATAFKGYSYDLSGSRSLCVTDGRTLDRTPDGDGYKFTLLNVEQDSTIILTGMQRMYYIHDTLHDGIRITPYSSPASGSLNVTLSLPSGSQFNAIESTVWMGGANVTGNVVSGNDIRIPNLTGDVYIFADGKNVEKPGSDFPWWIVALAGAVIAALLIAMAFLLRKKKAVMLSSSVGSFHPVASRDFSGKAYQFLDLSKSRDMDPVYVFAVIGKDSYRRDGYRFEAERLPAGLSMSDDGVITGKISSQPSPEDPCSFVVRAIARDSNKTVCSGEFRYAVSE